MKKIFWICVFITYSFNFCKAQNLVPNPSFEEYTSCPPSYTQWGDFDFVQYATGWSSFGNTADYFNSCSHDIDISGYLIVNVPTNFMGFQYAASGDAYCGLITFDMGGGYQEFIGAELISPLNPGTKYFANVKVSLGDKSFYASSGLGIAFSNTEYNDTLIFPYLSHPAKIILNNIITDTLDWTTISGSFVADSAYKYIVIGRFFPSIDTMVQYYSMMQAYYYIDNVCVTTDSLGCDFSSYEVHDNINENHFQLLNISPNPATDKIFISNNSNDEFDGSLVSILGEKLKTFHARNNIEVDVSEIPTGIYILQIKSNGKLISKKQVVIH